VIVVSTSLIVLLTAGACSVPGFSPRAQDTLGIIKRDPSVLQSGFGRVNNVQTLSGEVVQNGLGGLSGLKLEYLEEDTLWYLSRQKGLFISTNGGRFWERKYIFEVSSPSDTDEDTFNSQIAANDALRLTDFALDPSDPQTIYVSGLQGGIGKIWISADKGETFREIYSEVEQDIAVQFLAVDSQTSGNVYAMLEEGALIASRDGGRTWTKLREFNADPVQMGFVEEFGDLFYILFANEGLFISEDNGVVWNQQQTTKAPSEIGEQQPKDSLDVPFVGSDEFGVFEKILPVRASNDGGWILIADGQLWYSETAGGVYRKLVLPLQGEQFNLLDAEPDPEQGLGRLYVSIDNKLFRTENRGESWTTGDLIQLSTPIGQIGEIVIDPGNPEIQYLMLVEDGSSRGLFG